MDNEHRKRALIYMNILNVAQEIVCLILLVLGLVSRSNHGSYKEGVPPYFTGAFIGMVAVGLHGVLGFIIFFRGKNCKDKNEAAKKIGCIMQLYCVTSIACGIAYLAGLLLVGFTGICTSSDCSYITIGANRRLAITLIVFILVGMVSSAIGLAIVCIYSASFGFKMFSRGQYQISNIEHIDTIENETPVVAYDPDIAAIEAVASVQPAGLEPDHHDHIEHHHHHHHHHHDSRFDFPSPEDFSRNHLQHFLTQQYKERIRKRKRKNKKKNRDNPESSNEPHSSRRNGREAHYVLPPLTLPGTNHMPTLHSPKKKRAPSPPSPPPPPTVFLPPSPPPPPTPPPPANTPPLSPPAFHLPKHIPPSDSPPPRSDDSSPPALGMPHPPTPPRKRSVKQAFHSSEFSPRSPSPRSKHSVKEAFRSPELSPTASPRTTRSVFITQLYSTEYSPRESDLESASLPPTPPSPSVQGSQQSSTPPPTPPFSSSRIIHVIPCGETIDDDPPLYTP